MQRKRFYFFQSLCEVAFLHFCILGQKKMASSFLAMEIYKRMMCEAKPRTRLNIKSENLPEIALSQPQHHHRFY